MYIWVYTLKVQECHENWVLDLSYDTIIRYSYLQTHPSLHLLEMNVHTLSCEIFFYTRHAYEDKKKWWNQGFWFLNFWQHESVFPILSCFIQFSQNLPQVCQHLFTFVMAYGIMSRFTKTWSRPNFVMIYPNLFGPYPFWCIRLQYDLPMINPLYVWPL